MTYHRAKECIEAVINSDYRYDETIGYQLTSDDFGWLELARDTIEMRIPKKPKFYDTKFRQRGQKYGELVTLERAYNCPHCNCTVWEKDRHNHCDFCGQALDWSNTEKGGK